MLHNVKSIILSNILVRVFQGGIGMLLSDRYRLSFKLTVQFMFFNVARSRRHVLVNRKLTVSKQYLRLNQGWQTSFTQ
jgi:hypothetical protein